METMTICPECKTELETIPWYYDSYICPECGAYVDIRAEQSDSLSEEDDSPDRAGG